MARKPRVHLPGGVYHVMLRGGTSMVARLLNHCGLDPGPPESHPFRYIC